MIRITFLVFSLFFSLNLANAVELKQTRTACLLNKNMTLTDLRDAASIVFRGKFEDFKETNQNGLDARTLKFKVNEVLKGLDEDKKTLVLTEWARTKSPFTEELIARDKEYVFFFYQPSDAGFTSLVGIDQGMVTLNSDKSLVFSTKLTDRKAKTRKLLFFSVEQNIDSYQDLKKFIES